MTSNADLDDGHSTGPGAGPGPGIPFATRVNVGDSLTRSAARYPDRIALVDGERRLSYAGFDAEVNRLANALLRVGYTRGDALALVSGNSVEFLAVYYACAKVGAVCVPINLGWRPHEIAYVLGHSRARGVVVEAQLVVALEPALTDAPTLLDVVVAPGTGAAVPETVAGRHAIAWSAFVAGAATAAPECQVGDRDPISYLYTSGTTSSPKGVVGTHTAIYLESMATALDARFAEDDRFVAMMPMFHTAQLNAFCTPAVMLGATTYVLRGFDPALLLELIERERITQVFGLPMMYRALLDHPDLGRTDVSSLRRACYAMAPMPDEQLRRAIEAFDCDFFLLFGQTEMSPATTFFRPEHQLTHSGAVGTPLTGVHVGIMAPDGALLPRGEEGEIVYRSPHALAGYLDDPQATAAAFERGWFHSGDIGRFGADGVLWFTDRTKDLIKTGGENVASLEVEKALYATDPRILEVVAVGLPHERWSEAITAVVVAAPGEQLDEAELLAGVRAHLDPYKVPKSIVVLDQLPRTSTGKVQKNVLRDQLREHYSGRPR